MTGLDVEKEVIMEAAIIVTDSDLNVIAEGPNLILNVDSEKLDNMNDWCKKQHGQVNTHYLINYFYLLVITTRFYFVSNNLRNHSFNQVLLPKNN